MWTNYGGLGARLLIRSVLDWLTGGGDILTESSHWKQRKSEMLMGGQDRGEDHTLDMWRAVTGKVTPTPSSPLCVIITCVN